MLRRIAVLLVLLCLATSAQARSGGSMGGGSFRSRSGGSSFGSGSSGSRSFSSPTFGGGSSYGGGTRFVPVPIGGARYYGGSRYYGPSASAGVWLFVFGVIFLIVIFVLITRRMRRQQGDNARNDVEPDIATARVQVGLQTLAWPLVEKLDVIARKTNANDSGSLHNMLVATLQALGRYRDNIEYAAAEQSKPLPPIEAERQFGRWTGEARLSYDREVVRSDRFGVQEQQREVATDGIHDEDGQLAVAEFFVLTIVIATRGLTIAAVRSHDDLKKALDALAFLSPGDIVALEIVWSPAAKSDAMSRDDMETTFPALRPL